MLSFSNTNDGKRSIQAKPLLWLVLLCYTLLAFYTILHHEPWGDELHSWNIAKGSHTYLNLISNSSYEGHPMLWYSIMWCISKCTHQFIWVQLFHISMAVSVVYVMLFYAPLSLFNKILLPFGYYFLFEYSVISRNYVVGILMGCLICIVFRKDFKYKHFVYYLLLFIMSNTHLLAAILAGCLHLYFLMSLHEKKVKWYSLLLHAIIGMLIFMPALYCIWPPADSEWGAGKWSERWTWSQLAIETQTPLRAFMPMPIWWNDHFWNQQFLLEPHERYPFLKFVYPVLSFMLVGLACFILRKNRKSVILFLLNLLLTSCIGNVLSLATQRYAGFVFISFLIAYWLYRNEKPLQKDDSRFLRGLLVVQLIAGVFAIIKDIRLPFSNYYRVNELVQEVPLNGKIVTDYWALIAVSAYVDKPVYSIDMQETVAFSKWKVDMLHMRLTPYRYCRGLNDLYQKEGIKPVYLITTDDPELLNIIDPKLFGSFHVRMMDKRDGAIEKSSNLYLYEITSLQ